MQHTIFTRQHTIISLIILVIFSTNSYTQSPVKCGYQIALKEMEKRQPGYIQDLNNNFEAIGKNGVEIRNNEVFKIPVVFHVVYNTDRQNIDDTYIFSQLKILNEAFNHVHSDTGNTREIFKPFAGDAKIEFYLATEDPAGQPTTGITRTFTEHKSFGDLQIMLGSINLDLFESMKYTSKGGEDAWPTNRYLNIWIADAGIDFLGTYLPALLGLATPPRYPSLPSNWPEGSVDGITDGVFLQYQTIGLDNPYSSDLMGLVSQGRTAVHEVGHYLGLRHIGGDENCGNDGIDDTPVMNQSSQEADKCPLSTNNSCDTSDPNDLPDQWENYMDYSNDLCQTMFTIGQVSHMRKVIENQRDTLISGTLKTQKKAIGELAVFPNPAVGEIYLNNIKQGGTLAINNSLGQNALQLKNFNSNKLDISLLTSGLYIISYLIDNQVFITKLIILRE